MELKRNIVLLLVLLVFGCKHRNNYNENLISIKEIDFSIINSSANCKQIIYDTGLTKAQIDKLLFEISKEYPEKKYEKLVLIFFVKYQEVINYYYRAVLVSKKNEIIDLYISNGDSEKITIPDLKNLDINHFLKDLKSSPSLSGIAHNKLLLIEINKNEISCNSFQNISYKKSNKIIDFPN